VKPSFIELNRAAQANWFGLVETARCGRRGDTPQRDVLTLQLNNLCGVNVLARAKFAEQLSARGGIEIQNRERGTACLISAE
jgi:hypothetical protein